MSDQTSMIIYPTVRAAEEALVPALRQLEQHRAELTALGDISGSAELSIVTAIRKTVKTVKSDATAKLKELVAPFKAGIEGIDSLYKPTITAAGELFDLAGRMITTYDVKIRREAEEAAREHVRLMEEARVLREAEVDAYAEEERREAGKAAKAEMDRIAAAKAIEDANEKARQLLADAAEAELEGNTQAADGYREMAEEVRSMTPDAPEAPFSPPEPKPAPAPWVPPPPPQPTPAATPRQAFAAAPVTMRDNWVAEVQSAELLILAAAEEIKNGSALPFLPKGRSFVALLGINQALANDLARVIREEKEIGGLLIVNRRYPVGK